MPPKTIHHILLKTALTLFFYYLIGGSSIANGIDQYEAIYLETPGTAMDIAIQGDHAFVASYKSGLIPIDLNNNIQYKPVKYTKDIFRVYECNNILFAAIRKYGLNIFDIIDPAVPHLLGSYNTDGTAMDVIVDGSIAYIADGSAGLQIIDTSNPSQPKLISSFATNGYANALTKEDALIYIANGASGIQLIDVQSPTSPKLIATAKTPGYAQKVFVHDKHAYVADGPGGLQVFDLNSPRPTLIGTLNTG
jgi:hypothetical protein